MTHDDKQGTGLSVRAVVRAALAHQAASLALRCSEKEPLRNMKYEEDKKLDGNRVQNHSFFPFLNLDRVSEKRQQKGNTQIHM